MPTLVSTGQLTITDVNDGLHARLSSEQHAVPTGSEGEAGDYAGCETTMTVLRGTQDDSASWSFSAAPTAGITGSLVGSTYVVTNMTTDAGYVDITASRVGFPNLTSRFSISKAKRGWAGPAITLVVSSSGFTFIDNVAEPAVQSIALTVVRHGAVGPVTFYATNGVELVTDNGQLQLCNYLLGTFGCGQGDTAYLDLAQFGDNQQVTITAVCGELTATKTLVRLAGSTAAAGATVGAIWGQNVVNQPSFTDFLETFEGDASLWQNYSGAGEVSVVSITDGQSGGKALRIGNSSGNDMAWLIHKQNIAFDPNATYRVKFRARSLGGAGKAYFGIAGVAADGTSLVNITGGNSNSNQHYIAAADVSLPGTWTEYVGFVKGVAATGIGSPRTVVTNPAQLHQATKYIRPMVLVNYNGVVGQAEIDYVRIELLTDSVNWDVVTGAGKDTLITTANNASTAATTANNLLADIASDNKLTPSEKNNVKREWDGLVAEKAGINTQASAFSITTENTAYNTSYDTLNAYLTTLLASMTTTSDITGSTLRTNFSNLYSARQALLNKIAEVASTRSNWTSVSGKPTDEQIMNVLVSQGVYNGVEFPYSGRSLFIPCYVDNNQGVPAWYKLAEAKLVSPYNGFSFVGSVTWGQSSKRFNARADIKISFSASSPATTFQDQVYKFAGDDPTGVLKVRLSQDGNGLWTIGIYAYLTGFKGLMLDGNWYTSTTAGSWVDDYQTSTTQLAGDPGLTNFAPSANYELGATRNVHRGDWANSTPYALGDTVLSGGYGWSCILAHTSVSGTNSPPAYPTTANTWWTLAAVKGEDAKVAMLTASSFVFKVAQDGTVSPSSIALTAMGQNLAGSPTFTVTSGTAVLTGTGEARVLTAASLATDQAIIKLAWDGREDYVTVTKVREGSSGLTVVAGNEAHALPADNAGSVTSYAGSGTTIEVFEGGTALAASGSAVVSAFRIGTLTVSPAGKLTPGAVSYAGTKATIAVHAAMDGATDTVNLTIPVTIYRADGTSTTINKVQTLTKSKAGVQGIAGNDAIIGVLSNETQTIPTDKDGNNGNYAGAATTLTIYKGLVDDSANWTYAVTKSNVTCTEAATSRTQTVTALSAETGYVEITATRAGYAAVVKRFSLAKVKTGATGDNAIVGILSNEAHTIATDSAGNNGVFTGAASTLTIYNGLVDDSANWTYAVTKSNVTCTEAATSRTQTVTALSADTGYVEFTASRAGYASVVKRFTLTKSKAGVAGAAAITVLLSNEAHVLPADSAGAVTAYAGSGTQAFVYEGSTPLTYDGVGTANGTWKVTSSGSNITPGSLTDSGTYLTVGDHSGVAAGVDTATITYTITGKTAGGQAFSLTKQQTFSKSKAGAAGAQGPAVRVSADRPTTFTATDGGLDGSQANIVFTASVSGIGSPTYVWSFSGFQTAPTNSGTASQTITAAQFGTAKSATVTCTVNGTYVDKVTIVRLEKSTAAAGATVGADGSNLSVGIGSNLLPNSDLALSIGQWNVGWISDGVGDAWVSRDLAAPDWCPIGGHTAGITRPSTPTGSWDMLNDVKIPVTPGSRYEMSGRLASHRCTTALLAVFYTAADVHCGEFATTPTMVNGGQVLSNFAQHVQFVTAPANAAYAKFVVRSYANGGANPYSWLTQPMFCLANAGQTVASPWSPSNFNEKITAGNIAALIESAAIGSAYIGNAAIGTAHIQDLAVDTLQVMDGAISNTNYGSIAGTLSLYNLPITGVSFIGPAFTGTGKSVHIHYSLAISNVTTTAKDFYINLYRGSTLIESTLVRLAPSQDTLITRSLVDPEPTTGANYKVEIDPVQDANGNVRFYNRFIFGTVLKK